MAEKRALLFINRNKNEAVELAEGIQSILKKRGWETVSFSYMRDYREISGIPRPNVDFDIPGGDFSLGISLGGDGTVLFAVRAMAPRGIPVMPVNLGTLGFIASVLPGQWEETFAEWEGGNAVISRRLMLAVTVERAGKAAFAFSCLNDAVVSASGIAKLIRLEVKTETAAGERIALGRFRSDGLIVATPTGSTGYSAAAGGPIIDPEMETVIITPICPFTLSNRPIVVPSGERVITLVEEEQRSAVLLTVDGQITGPLEPGDRVITRQASYRAELVASDRDAFYRALRTKLGWSGGAQTSGGDITGYEEGGDA